MHRRLLAVMMTTMAVMLCACTPSPTASPTPTPAFASKQAAFAAAEATYRAYVDALNQVVLSDPATFEPVFALTTGAANADLRKSFAKMHADGWHVSGQSVARTVDLLSIDARFASAALAVCLDVSAVTVRDATGASVVQPDREDVHPMRVDLVPTRSSPDGWRISDISGRSGEPACRA